MKKILLFVSIICFFLDQISKFILEKLLTVNESIDIIPSFFSITFVKNEGAAWSLFSGEQLFLIFVTIIAIPLLYFCLIKNKPLSRIEQGAYGLLYGGIFGNLMDRVFRGYVVDFLDFNILGYSFPIFNIADIAIVVGVFLTILLVWKGEKESGKNKNRKK